MKKKLLNISGKIDPALVAIYSEIANIAKDQGVELLVIGASARDIVLLHGYDIQPKLSTNDIDFAIQVASWDEFNNLREGLIETGNYRADRKIKHRLYFQENMPIDIIPFGALVGENHQLSWPPGHEINMNMLGYNEAHESSINVRLRDNPLLDLKVVSPASYVVLKLIAWCDRADKTNKDALDIALIMRSYMEIDNERRLANEHSDITEDDDFDYRKAGARMLGRDIAKLSSDETLAFIKALLKTETDEQKRYKLVESMSRGKYAYDFDECLELLESLNFGIND